MVSDIVTQLRQNLFRLADFLLARKVVRVGAGSGYSAAVDGKEITIPCSICSLFSGWQFVHLGTSEPWNKEHERVATKAKSGIAAHFCS